MIAPPEVAGNSEPRFVTISTRSTELAGIPSRKACN